MLPIFIGLLALTLLYLYCTRTFNYWKVRGIKHDRPLPLFGNNLKGFLLQKSIAQTTAEIYWKYPNEKAVGFFTSSHPSLIVRDPQVIKRILVTDFANFHKRGLNAHKTVIEPLLRNLFFADGDLWRLLRQRMTPAFTSGKLKAMFPLIVERAERLQSRALQAAADGRPIDARDLMARYTTDFIGACGFGLDADSLNDEESAFRKLGAKIFSINFKEALIGALKELFPETFKNLRFLYRIEGEMMGLTKQMLKERNYEPSGRNDFIDLMLECKRQGLIEGDSIENFGSDGKPERTSLQLTDELIAAQVFVFFAAGFETSSSATSFTLLQLAYHPEVQRKVQKEIDSVLAKYHNKLSYDAIKEMTYLEWAFKEGMRMFPSLGFLARMCAKKTNIPELNITVDEDVAIFIPLQALHNDPQYFEEPEVFRPERFSPENFNDNLKYVYLPFGDGPRACIGLRLGMMQSLAGLAAILSRFTVEPGPSTKRYPTVNPRSNIVQTVLEGLPLIFRQRDPNSES